MPFSVDEFTSNFIYGGARACHFYVQINNPELGSSDKQLQYFCKSASLPAWNENIVEANYMGRATKWAGKKTFADWDVTIYNDEDFKIRNAMEQWHNAINGVETNLLKKAGSQGQNTVSASGTGSNLSQFRYKSDGLITQMSKTGEVLRVYHFVGLFPSVISPIEMNWDNDAIEEFGVTFAYDYFYVDKSGQTGDAAGKGYK